MLLTIKPYLHLNCVLMLNWIIWNWTVFDIETILTLNWIVIYNCLNSLKWKCFWQWNCVLMLNWIALNRTDYLHKMDLALNNLQGLICHKTQQTKPNEWIKTFKWISKNHVFSSLQFIYPGYFLSLFFP